MIDGGKYWLDKVSNGGQIPLEVLKKNHLIYALTNYVAIEYIEIK